LVFIHEGFWRSNEKTNCSFIALANINYGLAPETPMGEIIAHARDAVTWLYNNAAEGNFGRAKIHIAGRSAGGHLAAELVATD